MKWKNGVSCALLAFALLVAGASSALAAPVQVLPSNDEEILLNDKAIYVNGQYLPLNVSTYESGGSVLVPLRAVSTALGAQVQWQNGQVEISLGGKNLLLRPGSAQAQVNGQAVQLSQSPQLRDGAVFVPLRFVGEQLGAEVSYADHIIDIEPAAGAKLPVWSGGLPNGPEANCAEDADNIYLAVFDKQAQLYRIKAFAKETLAETVLYETKHCDGLQVWDGNLYFSANGKLMRFDLQSKACEQVQDKVWRFSVYDGWLYWCNSADRYGGELVLQRSSLTGGEAQQVASGPMPLYWFAGDKLYYNYYDIKTFCADLDGQNAVKLAQRVSSYDNGWEYFVNDDKKSLYRCHEDGSGKQLLLTLQDGYTFQQVKAIGSKVFYSTYTTVNVNGRSDSLSGPLFYVDLASKNWKQLSEGRCGDFYVLRHHFVYYNYDEEQWHIVKWE